MGESAASGFFILHWLNERANNERVWIQPVLFDPKPEEFSQVDEVDSTYIAPHCDKGKNCVHCKEGSLPRSRTIFIKCIFSKTLLGG
jgi:hypothetical protein